MKKMRKTRRGFSLIELIITLTITVTLGAAIYTTFAQAMRLWNRAVKTRAEWKVGLFLDQLTHEFRNEFQDPRWGFQGDRSSFTFATLGWERRNTTGKGPRVQPVYLRYGFDAKKNAVTLRRFSFEDVMSPKVPGRPAVPVLEDVRSFEVTYYVYDTLAKAYRWKYGWNKNCFPGTVKVTIEPRGIGGRKISRIIEAPAGVS
ncbi:MAG: prepilin-type N-terminal cleavage/methylation domain-containing protein [Candidatus Omnitrophica bacterium]|nr:prepilin-type N-terminal cleavage/methylation domain-containing protein [Candidatus Omnitrophota bacterium]